MLEFHPQFTSFIMTRINVECSPIKFNVLYNEMCHLEWNEILDITDERGMILEFGEKYHDVRETVHVVQQVKDAL